MRQGEACNRGDICSGIKVKEADQLQSSRNSKEECLEMADHTENMETVEAESRQSLEEMFAQLEDVIAEMEEDGISLEHSFDLYNKGMGLLKECSKSIDEVEKKVLILDEDGETHEF